MSTSHPEHSPLILLDELVSLFLERVLLSAERYLRDWLQGTERSRDAEQPETPHDTQRGWVLCLPRNSAIVPQSVPCNAQIQATLSGILTEVKVR